MASRDRTLTASSVLNSVATDQRRYDAIDLEEHDFRVALTASNDLPLRAGQQADAIHDRAQGLVLREEALVIMRELAAARC